MFLFSLLSKGEKDMHVFSLRSSFANLSKQLTDNIAVSKIRGPINEMSL